MSDFDQDRAAAVLYGGNQNATTTEDPVAARERNAAEVLYGKPPAPEVDDGKSIAGQSPDEPKRPEDVMYRSGEKHVADLYYRGLKEHSAELAVMDEDGAEAGQVHRELAQGLHQMGIPDTPAREVLDDVLRTSAREESAEQYHARQRDLTDFIAKQDASFRADMALAGELMTKDWGENGRAWIAHIEQHATPALLDRIRDMVRTHRRAKAGY